MWLAFHYQKNVVALLSIRSGCLRAVRADICTHLWCLGESCRPGLLIGVNFTVLERNEVPRDGVSHTPHQYFAKFLWWCVNKCTFPFSLSPLLESISPIP